MKYWTIGVLTWLSLELVCVLYLFKRSKLKKRKIMMYDLTSPDDKTYNVLAVILIYLCQAKIFLIVVSRTIILFLIITYDSYGSI